MPPRILIATTTWWAMPARLALAFSQSGAEVFALCPRGSPISKVRSVCKKLRYRSMNPLGSLSAAIEAVRPDLIVPCDDRVVGHLHRLHEGYGAVPERQGLREIIEKSLGAPAGYPIVRSRAKLLALAGQLGILVPETALIGELADLRRWADQHGFPLLLKSDGTWGGAGVRVANSWADAERAFTELSRPLSLSSVVGHLSFHNFYPLSPVDRSGPTVLTSQGFITGECCNTMVACWSGAILDGLSVDVLFSAEALGASSLIRTKISEDMDRAAGLLVGHLGISGLCGLDFITERETGNVYLIELNPRATQLGHLRPGRRASLAQVLLRHVAGDPPTAVSACVEETIAFFPQPPARSLALLAPSAAQIHHDIPMEDPDLLRELQRPTWNLRHLSAFVYLAVRRLLRLAQRSPGGTGEKLGVSKVKTSL